MVTPWELIDVADPADVSDDARERMGPEQLHLSVRGGEGLEPSYESLGRRRVGRRPIGIRLAPGDSRDEVLFVLDPL